MTATTDSAPKQFTHELTRRTTRTGRLYIAPALIVVLAVGVLPGLFLYGVSLFDYNRGTPLSSAKFVGFDNYTRLLSGSDGNFWPAVGVTIAFLLTSTATTVVLGTIFALLLDRILVGRRLFTTLFLVPLVMAPVMAGLLWRLMFNDLNGALNAFLRPLGLDQAWLGSPPLAFLSVLAVETWQWTPFVALIMFAGIRSLDYRPKEAAQIDGANAWQVFRHITFPMLQPIFGLVVALRLIDSVKVFDTAYALTQGGPGKATETLGLMIFHYGLYTSGWIGRASAIAVLLLILVILVSQFVTRYLKRAEGLQG
ncbi:carbohydrate ABC transporter membrane protein 1, CUT1 family [Leifsonia sp. 98AMF]|uniref:carbohydrate ABC transporter permease n=1 Tax=unclassified Leifsonia TaxID=2663824 RepID=UPI00087DB6B1|nr:MULTISPECIES: sugar ABC transporter permease [unclassified Leifsonia]SDH61750.1 carbohydrate ABC transporter membrane protein 1, CUT1 family [Leifsonia sp. 197AMF]SDI77358.1 carbohydrate ABC transporter membrane protein 1, CUT1 family [Leifsonia sp. 466MF]SDK09487.1 carbohydrate ABC transporter membrane protein 1, CUT1 family [Leifsonia sp. 157MF]SDN80778.1 carbohydrate ABC transporter membrane protein 1, CUT1 family [Leifsonia sp. 509MF]SEB09623.1 carbohydrate ABC transporter membrane prot